jgi:hypothetical protein
MRSVLFIASVALLGGCSYGGVVHHSPYDLNRDGTLDARCPGMAYDTSENTLYGWRSDASGECADQAPMAEEQS